MNNTTPKTFASTVAKHAYSSNTCIQPHHLFLCSHVFSCWFHPTWTIQLCQTFWPRIFLTLFVSNAGKEKDWCFFKHFPFLIANMYFYTRRPITINVALTSALVIFPSLSGLDTLFPHHCTFFILLKQTTNIFLSLASSFFFQGDTSRTTLLYSLSNCLQLHMYALLKTAPDLQ